MLIRVKRVDVQVSNFIQPDALDLCLECWKNLMGGSGDRDLGAKTMGGLVGNSDGYGRSADEEQQARDLRIAAATDAMIDSLSRLHMWAIYKLMGVGQVWRFDNADLLIVGPEAKKSLEEKLRRNTCTGILF